MATPLGLPLLGPLNFRVEREKNTSSLQYQVVQLTQRGERVLKLETRLPAFSFQLF
jgi:hypothetical protein